MTKYAEDIAEIKTDMKWVKEAIKNHMSQHFKVNLAVGIAVLGAMISIASVFIIG